MALLTSNNNTNNKLNKGFHLPVSKNALIIFTRNPELGKVKTRLAATVGNKAALEIYQFLISHTVKVSEKVNVDKYVFYSENIQENDAWNDTVFRKKLQHGGDLGERMNNAFKQLLKIGYEKVVIAGSDIYELTCKDIKNSFFALETDDFAIGPAKDGGYYLLGMKQLNSAVFRNKNWGTSTVFKDTMEDLKNEKVSLLAVKSDVDVYEDIENVEIFKKYLV
ncbi:MAG: TIGR04282 family arsenosugar biosynthesis glycosyltransferase [Flavobacteriaceae bacterium]|nr:TIGR04282 family arsenosugar biosynthesis glycosyltransferase [Flavobacteriaceae bacterium]